MGSNDEGQIPKLETNQALQTHGSRTPIQLTELHELERGDHIGWHRTYLIWHHSIVVGTNVSNRELHVIHFTKVNGEFEIAKQLIRADEEKGDLFRFDYSKKITDDNPPDLVVARAERRIGDKCYKLLSKNCEHFATFCKTGKEDSFQVRWARGKVKETINTTFVNGTKSVVKEVGKQMYTHMAARAITMSAEEIVGRLVPAIANEVVEITCGRMTERAGTNPMAKIVGRIVIAVANELLEQTYISITERSGRNSAAEIFGRIVTAAANENPAEEIVGHLVIAVAKEVRQTYRTIAEHARKVAAVKRICKALNWVGVGLVAAIETKHCAYDVYKIYQNKKAGYITDRDFKATTTQRITEGVIATGLAIRGGVLGEWVVGIIGGASTAQRISIGVVGAGLVVCMVIIAKWFRGITVGASTAQRIRKGVVGAGLVVCGVIIAKWVGGIIGGSTAQSIIEGVVGAGLVVCGIIIAKWVGGIVGRVNITQRMSEGLVGAGLAVGVGEWVDCINSWAIGSVILITGTSVWALLGNSIGGAIGSILGKAIGSMCGHWLGNFLWN